MIGHSTPANRGNPRSVGGRTSLDNKIGSFINQVNAFVNSGKLIQAQAAVLIDAANAAKAAAESKGGQFLLVTHASSGGSSSAVAQPITTVT